MDCGAFERERMPEIVFVSNVDVRRSIGRLGTNRIDQLMGVIPYSKIFVDQLVSTHRIKFDNLVRILFSIHAIVFEIILNLYIFSFFFL